mgnify:CR=1 FL=1
MNAIFIRRLLATAIILLSVSGARAQFSGFGYSFTLAGTIPDARLKNADGFSIENKEGFRVGPMVEYFLKNGFAFDAALYLTRYYTKLNDGNESFNFGRTFIEVPLNIKFSRYIRLGPGFALAPMIVTGPSLMFNVGRNHAGEYATQRRFQPGWNIGGGFDIGFLQVTVGYRFGLNNFIKRFDMRPDAEMRCNGIFVTAGLILRDFKE